MYIEMETDNPEMTTCETRPAGSPSRRVSPRITKPLAKARASPQCPSTTSGSESDSVSSSFASSCKSPSNLTFRKMAERAETDEKLAADPCIVPGSIQKTSVHCIGCAKKIKLDNRLSDCAKRWTQHRKSCAGLVKKGLMMPRKKKRAPVNALAEPTILADSEQSHEEHQRELWRTKILLSSCNLSGKWITLGSCSVKWYVWSVFLGKFSLTRICRERKRVFLRSIILFNHWLEICQWKEI
ncbi:hypothetical protein C8J56DRAFT_953957 [Mycena floridula]|nr:hypothetical protein C8J56DRAFT_953957 [Mycena floridula]